MRIAGRRRLIAAEDAGLYRDGAGVDVPAGLPAAFLEPVPDALRRLVLRHARGNGPFTIAEPAAAAGGGSAHRARRRWPPREC